MAENKPSEVNGLGWRWFSAGEDTYGLHRVDVDPKSADPGEVLYVKKEDFAGFVALVDFVSETVGVDGLLVPARRTSCPIEFWWQGTENAAYRCFGVPPARGDKIRIPGPHPDGSGPGVGVVSSVEWSYSGMGARTAVVFLT